MRIFFATLILCLVGSIQGGEIPVVRMEAEFYESDDITASLLFVISPEYGTVLNVSVELVNRNKRLSNAFLKPPLAQKFARILKEAIDAGKRELQLVDGDWTMIYDHSSNRRSLSLLYNAPLYGEKRSLHIFDFDYDGILAFIDCCSDAEALMQSWTDGLFKITGSTRRSP